MRNIVTNLKAEFKEDPCEDSEIDASKDFDSESEESDSKEEVTRNRRKRKKIKEEDGSFKCRDCREVFLTREELKEHRKTVRHPEVRNHACEICLKMFTSSKLKQHMRAHTKERPYVCKVCSQAFSMSGNLKRHMMTHTGERPHVCEVCGKGLYKIRVLYGNYILVLVLSFQVLSNLRPCKHTDVPIPLMSGRVQEAVPNLFAVVVGRVSNDWLLIINT